MKVIRESWDDNGYVSMQRPSEECYDKKVKLRRGGSA